MSSVKRKQQLQQQQHRITMASPHHSPSSPSTLDVLSSLCTTKSNQNGEISANEKDNRSSQKHNSNSDNEDESRKRDEPEDESERKNEHSNTNNKKVRVSVTVASLPPVPEPDLRYILDPPASFNTLDDDCLGNVLDYVGKKCYSAFGRVNKRCHEMFCSKGLPKETYLFGYGPLHFIQQKRGMWNYNQKISNGVLHYNRRDIIEWMLTDESHGYWNLKWLCYNAIKKSRARLDILGEVFRRANEQQLERLRDCDDDPDLCVNAAKHGKLECLKFLRDNECKWDGDTWCWAKAKGHEHILDYLRDNDCPTEWPYHTE